MSDTSKNCPCATFRLQDSRRAFTPAAIILTRRRLATTLPRFGFAAAALVLGGFAGGCATSQWHPPPPQGQTYQYDFQGFRSSDTTVVAGSGPHHAYAGVFSFRDAREVHEEAGGKNPFAQSAAIDGLRFNMHLEGQGARLMPAGSTAGLPGAPPAGTQPVPAKQDPKKGEAF